MHESVQSWIDGFGRAGGTTIGFNLIMVVISLSAGGGAAAKSTPLRIGSMVGPGGGHALFLQLLLQTLGHSPFWVGPRSHSSPVSTSPLPHDAVAIGVGGGGGAEAHPQSVPQVSPVIGQRTP